MSAPEASPSKNFRARGREKHTMRSQVELRTFSREEISVAAKRAMKRRKMRWKDARRAGIEWLMRMHYSRVFGNLKKWMTSNG
jgi:hypothetical protein